MRLVLVNTGPPWSAKCRVCDAPVRLGTNCATALVDIHALPESVLQALYQGYALADLDGEPYTYLCQPCGFQLERGQG